MHSHARYRERVYFCSRDWQQKVAEKHVKIGRKIERKNRPVGMLEAVAQRKGKVCVGCAAAAAVAKRRKSYNRVNELNKYNNNKKTNKKREQDH